MKKDAKDRNIKKGNISPRPIIPDSEKWLYENPEALASFNRGLEDAAEGKFSKVILNEL